MTLHDLPRLNAFLNGLSAVLLGCGYYFIRSQRRIAHRNCMIAAFCVSTVFLGSYLTYHIGVKTITHFTHPKWFKPIYLVILFTHVVLAMVILPLIIITLVQALRARFDRHKRIARWTWPLWMYVSVTGVLVYLMLYQVFGPEG